MTPVSARRAALLGLAMAATACDLVSFASDPKPILEQTWNLPAPSNKISVKDLLPAGNVVTILTGAAATAAGVADSGAFGLTIAATNITRVVGNDCAVCLTLNGTNAFKPQFILQANSSASLPQDVVSADVLGGSIVIALTNNMSFDPLYVKTGGGAQGFMVIVVRSGSLVLGRDSVAGAAAPVGPNQAKWPAAPAAGSVLSRTIALNSGTVASNLTVDVTVNSPLGDHNEFINANGTMNAVATVPSINVGSVSLSVTPRSVNSGFQQELPFSDLPLKDNVVGAAIEMTIANPFTGVTGTLNVNFAYGPGATDTIKKSITLPSGNSVSSLSLSETEMQTLLGETCDLGFCQARTVIMNVGGSVSSPTPVPVTPKLTLTIDNRVTLKIRTSSGGT